MMDKDKNAQLSFEEFQEGSKKGSSDFDMSFRQQFGLIIFLLAPFLRRSHHRASIVVV